MRTPLVGLAIAAASCTFSGASIELPGPDGQSAADASAQGDAAVVAPLAWVFERRLGELEVRPQAIHDDGMLTDNGDIIFAVDSLNVGQDLYEATLGLAGIYNPPALLANVSTINNESTVWASGDGLTLLFGRVGTRGLDIHVTKRAARGDSFPDGVPVGEATTGLVQSNQTDGLGALTNGGLTLVFSSNREGQLDLFEATRTTTDGAFEQVRKLPLSSQDHDESSPKMSGDGLELYFSRRAVVGGTFRVMVAVREAIGDEFTTALELGGLGVSTSDDDFSPNADGTWAVFTSARGGDGEFLYLARRQ